MRLSILGLILLMASLVPMRDSVFAGELSIVEIEQRLHAPRRAEGKKAIYREVLTGTASKEEKQQMLDLYKALAKKKPPRGSPEDWQKATAALVTAAEEIVSGEAKNVDKLRAAANCKGCHDAHRGRDPALAADGTFVEKPGSFDVAAPPQFVKLANISKDKLTISVLYYESVPVTSYKEEEVEMRGVFKKVQVPVTQMRPTLRQGQISMAYVRLFDSTGKEVKGDEVWNRLKPGMTLLRQTESKEIDPTFLKLLSPDALILAPSVLETPPAGK